MPGRAGRLASEQHSSDEPWRVRGLRPFVARKEMWGRAPWPLGAVSSSGRAPQRRGDARREQRLRGSAPLPRLLLLAPASATRRRGSSQCRLPCALTLSSSCGAVAHALLLSAWIRSLRATRLAHPLRTTDGRLRRPPADARPEPRGRALCREFSSAPETGACRTSRDPPGDARNNPCRRQGDQVVAPGSTRRRLLVEDDDGALPWAPMSSRPMAWRPASAAGRPLTGRASTDGRPGGEGPLGEAWDDQERVDPGPGLRPLSPAVAVVRTRPDGALACRPFRRLTTEA